ncbi:Xaa-Pro aminopeptidase [Isosphaeraceae bacterium EP7]
MHISAGRPLSWIRVLTTLALLSGPSIVQASGVEGRSGSSAGQPLAVFRARRAALIEAASAEARQCTGKEAKPIIVITGAVVGELAGKYRQDNDFCYLTGVEAPHASLILIPDAAGVGETLYLPPRDPETERFDGPQPEPDAETARLLGFGRVESTTKFLADLFTLVGDPLKRIKRPGKVVLFVVQPEGRGLEEPGSGAALVRILRDGAPTTPIRDILPLLHEMRRIKSPPEISLLRRAIEITGEAQAEVARSIRPELYEYQLEGRIVGAFLAGGAMRAGFPSIVGSGPNATVLHHMENNRRMGDGELVVCDIGAEYRYYTADITRTYPTSGTFTPRQRAVYQLVLDVQSDAAAQFQIGVSTLDSMHRRAVEHLKSSELRARDSEGVERTMDAFFTHGLGHYLGMDVHDVGDRTKPLSAGSVFTIEPGLYIPSEAIGVRIEDDYLVNESGLEKLSRAIPSEPDAVEKSIAAGRARP